MKTRFLTVCLTIGLLNSTFSQDQDLVSDLIKSKKFAFVVTKVENKLGLSGPSNFDNAANFYAINPSMVSIQASKKLTTDEPISSYLLTEYYRLSAGDGSYFTAFNIKQSKYRPKFTTINSEIFLVQQPKELLLKGPNSQHNSSDINLEKLNTYTLGDFKLVFTKKRNNRWLLKYKVGKKSDKRIFYLEVAENGNAVLKDQPSLNKSIVLYGNILRTSRRKTI